MSKTVMHVIMIIALAFWRKVIVLLSVAVHLSERLHSVCISVILTYFMTLVCPLVCLSVCLYFDIGMRFCKRTSLTLTSTSCTMLM